MVVNRFDYHFGSHFTTFVLTYGCLYSPLDDLICYQFCQRSYDSFASFSNVFASDGTFVFHTLRVKCSYTDTWFAEVVLKLPALESLLVNFFANHFFYNSSYRFTKAFFWKFYTGRNVVYADRF